MKIEYHLLKDGIMEESHSWQFIFFKLEREDEFEKYKIKVDIYCGHLIEDNLGMNNFNQEVARVISELGPGTFPHRIPVYCSKQDKVIGYEIINEHGWIMYKRPQNDELVELQQLFDI